MHGNENNNVQQIYLTRASIKPNAGRVIHFLDMKSKRLGLSEHLTKALILTNRIQI